MPITTTPVLSVVTACALLSLPLLATAATPQKWQINPQKTKVGFSTLFKKSIIEGTFHKIEGVINYDES
nr:hypothetical protein [Psychrobacter sp. PraFG1]UNK04582.1 hypothetical protein MN210_09930 [Psychrobacter sp. PraFG1]